MKLAQEMIERRGYEPQTDESRRSTESIVQEINKWTPTDTDRSVAAGITTDVEPLADESEDISDPVTWNRARGLPDHATREDRLAFDQRIVADRPAPPPSAAEVQLAAERFERTMEDVGLSEGVRWDDLDTQERQELLGAAVSLDRTNRETLIETLRQMHEDEIEERRDQLDYTGSDDDFAEDAEWLNAPTEAQRISENVALALTEIEKQQTQTALAEARAKEAAASELLMGEVLVRELGSNNPDELEARLSGLHGIATTLSAMDSSEVIDFVQGDAELAVQLQQGLWGIPPDDPIFQSNVRAFREIDRQLHAANTKARLAESFEGAPRSPTACDRARRASAWSPRSRSRRSARRSTLASSVERWPRAASTGAGRRRSSARRAPQR
jgi:hypothetical protein